MRPNPRAIERVEEIRDLASALSQELLRAEDGRGVDRSFRVAHSLKGVAAIAGAAAITSLADAIEDALDEIRLGRARLAPALRELLLEASGLCALAPDEDAAGEVIARLRERLRDAAVEPGADPLAGLELPESLREALTEYELARLRENVRQGRSICRATLGFSLERFEAGLERAGRVIGEAGELIATLPASTEAEISFDLLIASFLPAPDLGRLLDAPVEPVAWRALRAAAREEPSGPDWVRIPVEAIRAVEEAVASLPEGARSERLRLAVHRLCHVPASRLVARVEEALRALATGWGRQVRLVVEGESVELEVATAAALEEPLLHMVRNALDHGIEAPGERLRLGKPPAGTLRLGFRDTGDATEIVFSDDGAGIDEARVVRAAIAAGLADEAAVASWPPEERLQLIFEPGLTTAQRRERSGRGVGLDVVAAAVRRLGGRVRVESIRGLTTRFLLVLPRR